MVLVTFEWYSSARMISEWKVTVCESQKSAVPAGCLESADHLIVQAAAATTTSPGRRREWDLARWFARAVLCRSARDRASSNAAPILCLLLRHGSLEPFFFFPAAISSGASPPPGTQIWLRRNRTCVFVRVRTDRETAAAAVDTLKDLSRGTRHTWPIPGVKIALIFFTRRDFNYSSSAPVVFILADIAPLPSESWLGALVLMFWCRRLALLAEPRINGACQFRAATSDGPRTPKAGRFTLHFYGALYN